MWNRVSLIIGSIVLTCALLVIGMYSVSAELFGYCLPGYTRIYHLEPSISGESTSKAADRGCRPAEGGETVVLKPIHPDVLSAQVEKTNYIDQEEAVNGVVKGPSEKAAFRCVVLLEPIRAGETSSTVSGQVCMKGPIQAVGDVDLASSYLIADFYNRTHNTSLRVEYYGPSPCSSSTSYGLSNLPKDTANTFSSGKAYSNCDHIQVYDFEGFAGPKYSCGAKCDDFFAMNHEIESWKVTD